MTMDAAEQSFFAGCADGHIYQVELFRRVSTLVLLLQMLGLLRQAVQERSDYFCIVSGTTQCS